MAPHRVAQRYQTASDNHSYPSAFVELERQVIRVWSR